MTRDHDRTMHASRSWMVKILFFFPEYDAACAALLTPFHCNVTPSNPGINMAMPHNYVCEYDGIAG